jgi:hypothetical protein
MGEAKETVKGSGPSKRKKRKAPTETKNLIQMTQELMDEVSNCVSIKDDDTQSEGDLAKADNIRKAQLLRAAHTLLRGAKTLLEEYSCFS